MERIINLGRINRCGAQRFQLRCLIAGMIMATCSMAAMSQEHETYSNLDISIQYFQLKDQRNYGLVFNGGTLELAYLLQKASANKIMQYQAAFGFGPGFSKGIASINFRLKPVDLAYGFDIAGNDKYTLWLGPYLSMNYFFQLYPELQSGHALWFTLYDIGPRLILETGLWDQEFRLNFSNSLAGIASRPEELNETYYYTLNFFDLLGKMHSNFKAGSYNLLNHTRIELEWKNLGKGRNSLAYQFEYFNYKQEPRLDYLAHTLTYRLKLGGRK